MDATRDHEDEPATLILLAEKVMQQAIKPGNVAYCPTMDLIALATADEQVHIYRLNGQKVLSLSNKKPGFTIDQIRWKPNGQMLAIAFSNSSVSLINAQTGKVVHEISHQEKADIKICCLGWGLNSTDAKGTKFRSDNLDIKANFDDAIPTTFGTNPVDLPNDLAFLDIGGLLSRLSALPPGNREDDVFSSRASLDAIFHSPQDSSGNSTDVLLIGYADGTIHISVYDFFDIGSFSMRQVSRNPQISKPVLHSNHPLCSMHGLLVSALSEPLEQLSFVPLDLRLIPETGRYLSLLASKSTQLQNVLKYVKEVQSQIYSEFHASQDLPRKLMRNIEETLQEKTHSNFVNAAYHLVTTGNCCPEMKEWLVDELGERGHKRWDKATTHGYEIIRRLVHEHLLPALQHFGVLVSRLRGLSMFQESITNLGLVTTHLDQLLDSVNCLQLLAHHVLICTSAELRQFLAFSSWLKQEIETQGSNLSPSAAEDSPEHNQMLDYSLVLQYIQGAMLQSRLIDLLATQIVTSEQQPWTVGEQDVCIYELYKQELKFHALGGMPGKIFLSLAALIARLGDQCSVVFSSISETQKRKVRFGEPTLIESGKILCADMRMVAEDTPNILEEYTSYISIVHNEFPNEARFHRIVSKLVNGLSSTKTVESARVLLPRGTIKDIKFVDDEAMMIAFSAEAMSSCLLYIPYRKVPQSPHGLIYSASVSNATALGVAMTTTSDLDLSTPERIKDYLKHTFIEGSSTTPLSFEVNGRKDRRAACVVAQDRLHYRIFDLGTPRFKDGFTQ